MNHFSKKEKLQAGDEEKLPDMSEKSASEGEVSDDEFAQELEKYREEAQKFVDSHKKVFQTFAKDVSLDFKMGDAFYIDYETGEVNLDAKWFAEQDYSKEQILWAVQHELSHFRDFSQDPEGTLEHFAEIREKARETGKFMMQKWEEKYGKSDPDFIEAIKKQNPVSKKDPEETMNAVERVAYQMHHVFDNALSDIYVNSLLARKNTNYQRKEEWGGRVEQLYSEKLFPPKPAAEGEEAESEHKGVDYTDRPRHLQFTHALLRREMVPDEEVAVSEEVAEALNSKIELGGKEYSPEEILENFIKPRYSRDTSPKARALVIENTLEPVFEELLMKDLEDWEPEKPEPPKSGEGGEGEEGQGGEGGEGEREGEPKEGGGEEQAPGGQVGPNDINPFGEEYEEHKKRSVDQIDHEKFEEWAEEHEEAKRAEKEQEEKEREEEQKSPEQKAEEAQEKRDKEFAEKHNIDRSTMQAYRKVEKEIKPYLEELSALWQRIIYGTSKELERGMEGYYKEGSELDIQKTIEEWPKIQKGKFEETRIMKKMTSKEIEVKKPEKIRVRMVGDISGSMHQGKRHILEQCFVLLLSSLREFNTYLELTRQQTKSKLEVDTEAWAFGNHETKVKSFREQTGNEEEQAEIIRVFKNLREAPGGATNDASALGAILRSLSPEEKEKIEAEKIMEIVFEVTDGGSSAPDAAREAVDTLLKTGVIARAFQIGPVSQGERQVFNYVWNDGREEKTGEIVGEKIENLLPAITELLKQYLENVRV